MIEDPPLVTLRRPTRRPTAAQVAALTGVPTGHVADAMDGRGSFDRGIKACFPEASSFCGVALTCHAGPADNLAVMAALAIIAPGDVLIAAADGYQTTAIVGDLVLGMAKNAGAVGFVTDGCVRDLPGIKAVGLPCFAAGVTPNSPARNGPGTIGLPVVAGGVAVETGDIVVADADGAVVVPFALIDRVIARTAEIGKAEESFEAKVKAGLRVPGFIEALYAGGRVRETD
jgi:4-hydroxy-4-methyl-2-oxoglutarate aldolase